MKISYDKQADILYVWFSLASPPFINMENDNGDVVRIIERDGSVAGLIIPFAMNRLKGGKTIEIPEVGNAALVNFALEVVQSQEHEHAPV